MKKSRKIAVVLLACVALVLIWFRAPPPKEPVYEGKLLSAWLDDLYATMADAAGNYINDTSTTVQPAETLHQQATQAVKAMGTNALPTLRRLLRTHDAPGTRLIGSFTKSPSLTQWGRTSTKELRVRGVLGCIVLGPVAAPAIPELCELIKEGSEPFAPKALVGIGSDAVPALMEMLKDTRPEVRASAAIMLMEIKPPATSAISGLMQVARHYSRPDSDYAVQALVKLGAPAADIVPLLTNSMARTPVFGKSAVCDLLGRYGTNAQAAIPMLEQLAASDTTALHIQAAARKALQKIKGEPPEAGKAEK